MANNIVSKVISVILRAIFPQRWFAGIMKRVDRIKKAMTSNIELKVFWHILFLPIVLPISLLIALIKSSIIIISPYLYDSSRFILNLMYSDVVKEKRSLKLALKRAKLCKDLFVYGREKRTSYGDLNPDVVFYVIRPYYYIETNELLVHPQHLLLYYYYVLQKITYAVANGWLPVVDFEHYDGLLYFAENYPVNGTMNAWEYFWNQPSPYSLEEVYKSKNVILSSRNANDYGYIPASLIWSPHQKYAESLVKRSRKYTQYTTFNDHTQKIIDDWYEKLFPADAKVLGVVYRSTSYGSEQTANHSHPVQPELDVLVRRTKEKMKEWAMDYVYFVNEEEKNIVRMREEFGDSLIILPRKRYERYGFTPDNPNPLYALGERYNTNISYLTEVALLARCDALLGAMSSGTRAALIWNSGKYERVEIIDMGLW